MSRSRTSIRSLVALVFALVPVAAHAAWLPNGNAVAPQSMNDPLIPRASIDSDGAGGFFVATGNGEWACFVNHFDREGELAPGWPSTQTFYSFYPFYPYDPIVLADGTGGAVVFSSDFECEHSCGARRWTDLRVHRVTDTGAQFPGWSSFGGLDIGSGTEGGMLGGYLASFREARAITGSPAEMLTTWKRRPTVGVFSPGELCVQRIDTDGSQPWGRGGVVIHPLTNVAFHQAMVADGAGGAFVFFAGDHEPGLFGQHVDAAGHALWDAGGIPLVNTPTTVTGPIQAVADGDGGAIVAWTSSREGRSGVFAIDVTSRGVAAWRGDPTVFATHDGRVDDLEMVAERTGGAVLAWRLAASDQRILAQRLDHDGRPRWGANPVSVCAAIGGHDHVAIASDSRGGAYVAWADDRPDFSVYASHLDRNGNPARGWPVDGAPVSARRAGGAGNTGPMEVGDVQILAIDAGPPSSLAELRPRGSVPVPPASGREASAIVVWGYDAAHCRCDSAPYFFAMRLDPEGPAAAPVIAATAPAEPEAQAPSSALTMPELSLRAARSGEMSFALTDASPASLDLFDVSGRRVWSSEVGAFGAGAHTMRVADAVRPGVYLVRLMQGGRSVTARLAIVR